MRKLGEVEQPTYSATPGVFSRIPRAFSPTENNP